MSQKTDRPGISRRRMLAGSMASSLAAAPILGLGGRAWAAGVDPAAAKTKAPSAGLYPPDFTWGVATAAYQVEGAAAEDGRGPSVWDVFAKKPGAVFEGNTGEIACDHYHRYKEDVALMKKLGVKSYRFSVSWSRVIPEGAGTHNPKGFDFYSRLVDELLKAGISPMCTLFHWDFPQALYKRGGWLNRDVAGWFGDYAGAVADKLGDRVKVWATQNEPQCFIGLGLLDGAHAPGDKLKFSEYLVAAHNAMRAHGRAVQALRAHAKGDAKSHKIGYVLATQVAQPSTQKPEDIEAARWATFSVRGRNEWNNTWFTDPVVLGRYPEDGVKIAGKDMPTFPASDFDEMKQPLDYLGLNIYKAEFWRAGVAGANGTPGQPEALPWPVGHPRSGVDWQPMTPGALYWGPKYFYERYKLPCSITENGLSTRDQLFLDGKVHDPQRIDYMHRALLELGRAIKDGVPITGYYAWSLLDNYEWADGYKQRFGLVYVDYQTQRRIPKDSFDWYRQVIATHGKSLLGKTVLPVAQVTDVPPG